MAKKKVGIKVSPLTDATNEAAEAPATPPVHPEIQAQRAAIDKRTARAQNLSHVHHGFGTLLRNPETKQTLETDWATEIRCLIAAGWEVVEIRAQKVPEPGDV